MYLPSGKMIVALISLAFLSEQCDCAFFSRIDLAMYFSSGLIMVYLITNSFSLLFLPLCQVPCTSLLTHLNELVLFLLFLRKFLVMAPNF